MANKPNNLAALRPRNPRFQSGKKNRVVEYQAAFTSANSANNDLCILAGPLSLDDRIAAIRSNGQGTPALTSAADNDLGFWYKKADGSFAALSADVLWDGITLASAVTYPDLLTGFNANLDVSKNIGEHLNIGPDQMPHGGVYLVLRTNTANTAVGPLQLRLAIEIDEATTR